MAINDCCNVVCVCICRCAKVRDVPAILGVGWERKLNCRTTAGKLVAPFPFGTKGLGFAAAAVATFWQSHLPSETMLPTFDKIFGHCSCQLSAKKSARLLLQTQFPSQRFQQNPKTHAIVVNVKDSMCINTPAYCSQWLQLFDQPLSVSYNLTQRLRIPTGRIHNKCDLFPQRRPSSGPGKVLTVISGKSS